MNSRGASVPTVGGIGNGPNHDALRDIRKQIDTNNKKHEAVSRFNKQVVFVTILFILIQLGALIGCLTYFFIQHAEGDI